MAPSSDLATDIMNSVSCLLKDEKLADFTVIIEDTYFRCHRFILGACSRFFYAMFTTDMKEKEDNFASLREIDLSAFELVLKIVYTGENVVNKENVLSIWQTANRLQIPFLVSLCEKFAVSVLSMENYANLFRVAKMLNSKPVLGGLKDFMLKNFKKVKEDDFFLELSADELIELIQSDELNVISEDDVLFSIFKWVQISPDKTVGFISEKETNNSDLESRSMATNTLSEDSRDSMETSNVQLHPEANQNVPFSELRIPVCNKQPQILARSIHLQSLLTASRSCLASTDCLQTLYKHRLTQSYESVRQVIVDAILYQGKGYRHGYFPMAAMHRNCSEFEHVGVVAYDTGSFRALSFTRDKWYPMPDCREIKNKIKLALFDSSIYAIGPADDSISKLCVLKDSSWVSIAQLPGLSYFLLSHKKFLFLFNAFNGEVFSINPNSYDKSPQKLNHPEDLINAELALSFKDYILVFSKESHDGKEETAVHVWNQTWLRIENVDGPAENMASFQDGDKTYILQNNGNLWSLSIDNEQIIAFHFIKKLWDVQERLRGALMYKGKLFLYLKLPWVNPQGKLLSKLPGVYKSISTWARNGYASNLVCTIMHTQDMIKK